MVRAKVRVAIGVDYGAKSIKLDGLRITVHLWDFSGYNDFAEVRTILFSASKLRLLIRKELCDNVDIWFVVSDASRPETASPEVCDAWLAEIEEAQQRNLARCSSMQVGESMTKATAALVVAVLTKSDADCITTSERKQYREWTKRRHLHASEVSAKTGDNVDSLFDTVISQAARAALSHD
ncbi:MAG: hypothetical protein MHM6MM_007444 [Cercozoa sp. M6MM]